VLQKAYSCPSLAQETSPSHDSKQRQKMLTKSLHVPLNGGGAATKFDESLHVLLSGVDGRAPTLDMPKCDAEFLQQLMRGAGTVTDAPPTRPLHDMPEMPSVVRKRMPANLERKRVKKVTPTHFPTISQSDKTDARTSVDGADALNNCVISASRSMQSLNGNHTRLDPSKRASEEQCCLQCGLNR
jgi:hypothetical protein